MTTPCQPMGDELKELLKGGGGRIFKFGTPTSHTACSDSAMLFCSVLAYAKQQIVSAFNCLIVPPVALLLQCFLFNITACTTA